MIDSTKIKNMPFGDLEELQAEVEDELERRRTLATADEQLQELSTIFLAAEGVREHDPWRQPQGTSGAYPKDWETVHGDKVWISQVDFNVWEPGVSGWREVSQDGEIPEWMQPSGWHDAYSVDELVMFEGKIYRSVINNNTWSPRDYPDGWELEGSQDIEPEVPDEEEVPEVEPEPEPAPEPDEEPDEEPAPELDEEPDEDEEVPEEPDEEDSGEGGQEGEDPEEESPSEPEPDDSGPEPEEDDDEIEDPEDSEELDEQEWSDASVYYTVGKRVVFEGITYKCRQAHTSGPGWTPAAVPALWEVIG